VDAVADFTGTALDETFNASMATMQSLDVVEGGLGKDTLNIRDSANITSRSGTHTGFEVLTVESTAGSVGQVAAAATLSAKQQVEYNFGADGISLGTAGTAIVKVTVGGVSLTVGTAAADATEVDIAAAINSILNDAYDTTSVAYAVATGSVVTITAGVAGVALPTFAFAAGSSTAAGVATTGDGDFVQSGTDNTSGAGADVFTKTIQANQKATDAASASTFSVMTGATEVSITAATTANVSSVSTAATTVSAGGAVVLSGGASQAVTTFDSIQVSGGTGAIVATVAGFAPSALLARSSTTGWAEGAGVFIRGGTTVNVTEVGAVLNTTRTAAVSGNDTAVQIGADPTKASGTSGGLITNALTGAQTIGNLSSAPTGDIVVSARTTYTGTNGLTNVAYGTGAVTAFMNGGSAASVTGASKVSITDLQSTLIKASTTADALPGVSKLATVNLAGVTDTTAIKSDAIATISAVDTSSTITVTSNTGANTGGIALNVANSTVTLAHANATSVSVGGAAGSGRQSVGSTLVAVNQGSTVTLTTAKATSLEFSGANDVTLASSTLTALTTITSSATGAVNLGTVTGYAKVTSVDMSNAGGSASATLGATISGATSDRGFAYTGSAGSDTVTLTGAMKSGTSALGAAIANTINLGAGNDLLLSNGSGSIASGSAVNGGSGTDTIAASLLNAGNAAQITGFELLGLDKASGTYDTDLLAGAAGLVLFAQGATYTNVDTAQSLNVVTNIGSSSTTLEFAASQVVGTSDSYTVNFAAKGDVTASANPSDVDAGTLVVQGVENVTINSGKASGFADNVIDLTSGNLTTVTINGDMRLFLGFAGTNGTNAAAGGGAVKLIDGSAATGAITINTTNVVADNVVGLVLKTGSGKDSVILAANVDTVDLGAGDDSIATAALAVSLTLGAGKDTVVVAASKVATLADTSAPFVATLAEATGRLVTIKDAAKGDTIDFDTGTTAGTAAALGAATSVGAATSLLDALNALANSASQVAWTVYGGNTYVLYDAVNGSSDTDGVQANDIVVKFDGTFDFSTALYGATAGALTIA
jgi:hypothetical protein